MAAASPQTQRRRWRRKHTLLLVLGIVVLALVAARIALPALATPWLEEQLSASVGGRVEIGDVDLGLLRGRLVLNDGVLHTVGAPRADDTPHSLLAWDELALQISWRALLDRHLRLRRVALEAPRLRLVRTEQGGIDLGALLAEDETPEARQGPGWRVSIDRGALRDGRIRFRDLEIEGGARLRARVADLMVTRISFEPGSYERPGRFALEGSADDATLELTGRLDPQPEGLALSAELALSGLSLGAMEAYLGSELGWQALRGSADLVLAYERAPGEQGTLRGSLHAADTAVEVARVESRALGWDRLAVEGIAVDLDAQRASLDRLAVAGGTLLVVPRGPEVPALEEELEPGPEGESEADAGEAESAAAPAGEDGAETEGWHWEIAALEIGEGSDVRLRGREERPISVVLEATDVGPASAFPVSLELRDQEGSLEAAGSARLEPFGFEGTIDWNALDVARLLAMTVPGSATWITQATARGRIELERVDPGEPGAPGGTARLQTHGEVALTDVVLRGDEGGLFETGVQRLDLRLDSLRPPRDGSESWDAVVSEATLGSPDVRLTMLPDGDLLLPPFEAEATPDAETETAEATATETDPASGASAFTLRIVSLAVRDGTLTFQDRRVRPFFSAEFSEISGEVSDLVVPETAIGHMTLKAQALQGSPVALEGSLTEGVFRAEIETDHLALPPLNPYVTEWSAYRIEEGEATAELEMASGPDRLDLDLQVVLHDFELAGAEGALFREQFGVPLHVALALLRNASGDIALDVPIESSDSATEVNLVSLVGHAVARALMNSLVSPLKVLGTVRTVGQAVGAAAGNILLGAPERIASFEPDPIPFLPGRAEPSDAGLERIAALAQILSASPGLSIRLTPHAVAEDAAWLGQEEDAGATAPVLRELERARAERVETILVTQHGVPAERIERTEPPDAEPAAEEPEAGEEGGEPRVRAALPRVEIELEAS